MTVRSGRTRRDRSFIVPVVATFFLVLAACGSNSTTTEDVAPRVPPIQHRTLDVDGIERTYRLYTPSTLDRARPAPLVLVLGGVGNTAESMVGATEFDRMAQVGDFVVATAAFWARPAAPTTSASSAGSSMMLEPTRTWTRAASSWPASPPAP
jgi:poly(3-hydroxybutyrate) depolymerase